MLHAENAMMPVSAEEVLKATWRAVHLDHSMAGVIGPVGAIEAMIYLAINRFWYTNKYHLEEIFAFVRPDCRRSENAKALLEFAKTSALRLDVPLLIGIISNERTEAKVRMYERKLGSPVGAFFLYNGTTGIAH